MYVKHSAQHLTCGKPLINCSRYHHLTTSYCKYPTLPPTPAGGLDCITVRLGLPCGSGACRIQLQSTWLLNISPQPGFLASVPCSTRLASLAPRTCLNHPWISLSHALWFEMAGCLHRAASVTRLFFPALPSYCPYCSYISVRMPSAVNNRKADIKSVPSFIQPGICK